MLKKVFAWLHLWLGLISGIIVFVVSLTGCIHVFHEEIQDLLPKKPRLGQTEIKIPSNGRPLLKPSEIVRRIEKSLYADSIRIKPGLMRYYREKGSILMAGEEGGDRSWYTVDPYTGKVLEEKLETSNGTYLIKNGQIQGSNMKAFDFFEFILDGHQTLWLPQKVGNVLVTYGTLVFLVLLISGLILWWPKNKAAAKQRYWFQWKQSTQWRRKNYDLHNISGFYMLLFLFLIGFTGVCIGIGWMRESVHLVLSGEKRKAEMMSVPPKDPADIPDYNTTLDAVLKQEEAKHPDANTYSMYWSYPARSIPTSVIRVVAYMESESQVSNYDRYTTKLIGIEEHEEQEEGLAHQVEELYLPIHEGSIWGLPTKILAFIASLISASLPVTGFYIWWGRRAKNKKQSVSNPTGRAGRRPKMNHDKA